jgi:hypothetical protein
MNIPRSGAATISPNGVTRFWSGTAMSYATARWAEPSPRAVPMRIVATPTLFFACTASLASALFAHPTQAKPVVTGQGMSFSDESGSVQERR